MNVDNSPRGHLKPLGSHREPQNNLMVDELDYMPSAEDFWRKYVKPSRAAVLKGAAKYARAFTEWTEHYLKDNFGDLEVRVEAKGEKSGKIPVGAKGVGRDTIENFLTHFHQSNGYIVSELPTPMWGDIAVQPCLMCGSIKQRFVEVDLWLSGGGSSSILHKDAFNAMNCLYNGTKQWKLIQYKYEDKIYKAWEPDREIGGFSRINPEKVDLFKYPDVAKVPWAFVTLSAGDCIFLPKSMYHQVKSYGTMNVAVSILFSRFDGVQEISMEGCDKPLEYTPLSELDMDWKYSGHGNLSMGNPDLESIRDMLMEHIRRSGKLDISSFRHEYQSVFPEKSDAWIDHRAQEAFDSLDKAGKGFMTLEDIKSLNRDQLRTIAMGFEPTDLSNTEFHEYTYVDPNDVKSIISQLLSRDGKLYRQVFLKTYVEKTGGTEKFGKEILTKLSSGDNDHVTAEQVRANLAVALQPFDNNQRDPLEGENDAYNVYERDHEERDDRVDNQDHVEAGTKRDEL